MVSERMKNALALADKCWEKAYKTEPEFVERYLELAEELLSNRPLVTGDEFREFCARKGLRRPLTLHPNVWVSGVRSLYRGFGWIEMAGTTTPVKAHNHMPTVTVWRSKLYGQHP
jgi:hypothetical protein